MNEQKFDINSLRVASPCSISWEQMSGSDQTRFCGSCEKNVYNIAEMSVDEVRDLIVRTEGRFCARLRRRNDGTVMTSDCPVGLSAYRKRASSMAGAVLSMIFGLFSNTYGQAHIKDEVIVVSATAIKIERTFNSAKESFLSGSVRTRDNRAVRNAELDLRYQNGKTVYYMFSSEEGNFQMRNIAAGNYSLVVKAQGHLTQEIKDINIGGNENVRIRVDLPISPSDEEVVVLGVMEAIIGTPITGRQIMETPLTSRDALELVTSLPLTNTVGQPATSTPDKPKKP